MSGIQRIRRTILGIGLYLVEDIERRHLGAQLHRAEDTGVVVFERSAHIAVREFLRTDGHAVVVAVEALGRSLGQTVLAIGQLVVAHRKARARLQSGDVAVKQQGAIAVVGLVGIAHRARGLGIGAVEAGEEVLRLEVLGLIPAADVLQRDTAGIAGAVVGPVGTLSGVETLVPAEAREVLVPAPIVVVQLTLRQVQLGHGGYGERRASALALHRKALVGQVFEAVNLRRNKRANVVVALGRRRLVGMALGLIVGDHVHLEDIQTAVDDLGDEIASVVVAVGDGLETHNIAHLRGANAVLGRRAHHLVGGGDAEVRSLPLVGLVRVHGVQLAVAGGVVDGLGHANGRLAIGEVLVVLLGLGDLLCVRRNELSGGTHIVHVVGVGAHHIRDVPILRIDHRNGIGGLALGQRTCRIGLTRGLVVGSHAIGQHDRYHGQGQRALLAAIG